MYFLTPLDVTLSLLPDLIKRSPSGQILPKLAQGMDPLDLAHKPVIPLK